MYGVEIFADVAMNVSLWQALLIGVWTGIAGIDLFNGLFHIHRPIVSGMIVGAILGDIQSGLIVGGFLELVWAGMTPLAGAQPPNVVLGGIVGISFALILNLEAEKSLTFAIPFAVAMQGGITLLFSLFTPVMHKMDRHAKNTNPRGIDRLNFVGPIILFLVYFMLAFLPIQLGQEQATNIVEAMPDWLVGGLGVAGGLMPAIGFAMLLKIMLKKIYLPFFVMGFVLVAYLELDVLALALIAISFAAYDYYISLKNQLKITGNENAKEDYSDGI